MWFTTLENLLPPFTPQTHISHSPPHEYPLDVLTATTGDLRSLLTLGKKTSVDLVQAYLAQIAKHNRKGTGLNAITSTAPKEKLLEEAVALDSELKTCGPRSPLHGIPITIKDLFLCPSFGLETTCGSYALKGLKDTEDAVIATALRDAGCIIIDKDPDDNTNGKIGQANLLKRTTND
ncbi:amidase signature domain-containing protein [Astrocystis sublimbata]|nr:amidase signature domain-containing protein [Astrocystis sublimbata]